MEERRIEGLWDCAYCGTTGIKAHFNECTSCGRAKGKETVFYLPDDLDAATLTQEEKEKTTNEPDWLCEYCGAYNKSTATCCEKCAGDRTAAKFNYGMLHQLTGKLFGKKK